MASPGTYLTCVCRCRLAYLLLFLRELQKLLDDLHSFQYTRLFLSKDGRSQQFEK